ncbi:carboxymuconolactone decarboxylase family protein [Paraburkholderia phenazinium]|jgi:alkylhydroperoxidase family enzyme|uniref:Carboxymuconolactone decarboxylase family protein n=1 Tax=Paraburkholderia phenazinium TaxID=60549 RepID=A0A1G8JF98_9BURK|nr:carboxymuconolactone decarboxylase family protein [Paraburkholderia phenazinium]SDI29855.1 Carboxymuconolactone decarboxylase family protein [Paraburkholderia phenazinium]
MSARIAPAQPPFPPAMQEILEKITPPGVPVLGLFTTMARDERLFGKFFAGSLLDRGHLTLRQRELIIDRTTALCRSEYEWGVHMTFFGARAGFSAEQIEALVYGTPQDTCWLAEDSVVLQMCDALHRDCSIDEDLWQALRAHFAEEAILEMLMLAGSYRTVSYLTNALQLPLEAGAMRFPVRAAT